MDNTTNTEGTSAQQELNGIINQYSTTAGTQTEPDNNQTTVQEPAEPAGQGTEGNGTQTEPAPKINTQSNPANAAFAQMRTENAKLKGLLESYAQLNNLDANDIDAISSQLNEKLTAKQAQEAQVPPEFMKRFNEQQAMINAIMNQTAHTNLTNAFNHLKEAHHLDDSEAVQFAQELRDGNYDLSDLSKLDAYYKGLHFDELVKAEVQRALNDATVAKQYVDEHSATVATTTGSNQDNNSGDAEADTLAAIYAGLGQSQK